MTGNELIRRVRRLARRHRLDCRVDKKRGKGSHVTLYLGDRRTVVRDPKDELKPGTFRAMLDQLGIDKREI